MDPNNYIAYLYFRFLPNDKLIAGFLILDNRHYPKDFRYCISDDINPVQKTLYGEKLSSYLTHNACESLLENLEYDPSFILSNHVLEGEVLNLPYPFFHSIIQNGENKLQLLNPDKFENIELQLEADLNIEAFKRIENALKLLVSK